MNIHQASRTVLYFACATFIVCSCSRKTTAFTAESDQLTKTMEKAKSMGLPLTAADIKPQVPLDPKINMMPEVKEYNELLKNPKIVKAMEAFKAAKGKYDKPEQALKLCNDLDPVVQIAIKLSKKQECYLVDDWNLFAYTPEVEFHAPYRINNVLLVKARAEFDLGQWENGLRDIEIGARTNQVLEKAVRESTYKSAMDADAFITSTFIRAAKHWQHDTTKLKFIKRRFEQLEPLQPVTTYLDYVFFFSLTADRNQPEYKDKPSFDDFWNQPQPKKIITSGEPESEVQRAMANKNIQTWIKLYEIARSSKTDAKKLIDYINWHIEATKDKSPTALAQPNASFIAISQEAQLNATALRRCLIALIDVLLYKTEHKQLPKTLVEAGCNQIDPFSGTALRYTVYPDRFTISSIGPENSITTILDGNKITISSKFTHPIRINFDRQFEYDYHSDL